MKSLHRNGKRREAFPKEKNLKSAVDVDSYIDQALQHDRARLSGNHDSERSKVRAMGLLAAGAMPAAEAGAGGSLASWISKAFGSKGIAGTFTVIAVAGGVTVSTLLLTKSPERPAPPPAAASVQAPAVVPPVLPDPATPVQEAAPVEEPATRSVERKNNPGITEFAGAEKAPEKIATPAVAEPEKQPVPKVEYRSTSHGNAKVDLSRTGQK